MNTMQVTPFPGTVEGEYRVYYEDRHPHPKKHYHSGTFPTRQKARNWCRNHYLFLTGLVIVHPNGYEEAYTKEEGAPRVWSKTTLKFVGGPRDGSELKVSISLDNLPPYYTGLDGGYYSRVPGVRQPITYQWTDLRPGRYPPVGALLP